MSANAALIFDFNKERATRQAESKPRVSLEEALQRVERTGEWLASKQLCVLGFACTTRSEPVVIVAAHPDAWILFAGRYESKGHRRDGALRYEVWEGMDRINQVRVRWQEVSACA